MLNKYEKIYSKVLSDIKNGYSMINQFLPQQHHWLKTYQIPSRLEIPVSEYILSWYCNRFTGKLNRLESFYATEKKITDDYRKDIILNGKSDGEIYGWRRGDAINTNNFLIKMLYL